MFFPLRRFFKGLLALAVKNVGFYRSFFDQKF